VLAVVSPGARSVTGLLAAPHTRDSIKGSGAMAILVRFNSICSSNCTFRPSHVAIIDPIVGPAREELRDSSPPL
jgi:hypothetical protein